MALDDQDLSPQERALATRIAQLASDPIPERSLAIMAAVRSARPTQQTMNRGWRLGFAGVVAVAILLLSTMGVFAASNEALPSSPAYSLRVVGEQVRIALAGPPDREQLRISFAEARTAQARSRLEHGDRNNATALLRDSRGYLVQARNDLGLLSQDQQGQVQNQLNQAENGVNQAETQANQQGAGGG